MAAGTNQAWCVECKELVSSGCAYALCPIRNEGLAAVRETPRGGELQTDSGRFALEAIARSHEAVDNS